MARTPNYVLTQEYEGLPSGAYVKIVHEDYVPKETKQHWKSKTAWLGGTDDIWCHTGKGLMPIPARMLREV